MEDVEADDLTGAASPGRRGTRRSQIVRLPLHVLHVSM
jgi:hypothetical protein